MATTEKHQENSSPHSMKLLIITALGIAYGDIGTSPLYALREVFHGPHSIPINEVNLYGILSLITWALLIIISFKYLQIVLRADNKGEGGILALTALSVLQKDKKVFGAKFFLSLGIFGAGLVVGDSVITPAISVLSAVEGLQFVASHLDNYILPITFLILIILFSVQKKGTAKIGVYFGPVMCVWFIMLAVLGVTSIFQTPQILRALNPVYGVLFWLNNPGLAFVSLGAVFLVITGGEALYADMGHLGRPAISRGWFYLALPGLLLNYLGQGALLLRSEAAAQNPFYLLAPEWALVPLVILATLATIIASQAVISGFFSLASQSIQLGYCPRLNIIHTSIEEKGQIYVPSVNWLTLIGALWLVIEFKSSSGLASAYGITVSITMVITSILTALVAYHTWHWKLQKIFFIFIAFLIIDLTFVLANGLKIFDGGWIPLVIAVLTYTLMSTWKKGRAVLYERLRSRSYPFASLLKDLEKQKPQKVSGCAIYMVGDADVTPPALLHNLRHNKVIHDTVIFLTIIGEDIATVASKDKIQVKKLAEGFFRITGHYGFNERPDVIALLKRCEVLDKSFHLHDPTFFMGREILIAGEGKELSFWRKVLFSVMARNAASANAYFKLPIDRVIEVGMQIEL